MSKKTCNICLNTVRNPINTRDFLLCDCDFNVHYKCYYRWWRENQTCIICHKKCNKPYKNGLLSAIQRRRNTYNTIYTNLGTRYIQLPNNLREQEESMQELIEEYIQRIPFDNENELKALLFIGIIMLILYFFNIIV